MNLLDYFSLSQVQTLNLSGELLAEPHKEQSIHAKVELKLTPSEVGLGAEGHQVLTEAEASGFCGPELGADRSDVFRLHCKMLMLYKQFQGDPIAASQFSEHHASLARQIYPLVHRELVVLLQKLGLGHVQLPSDLAHATWQGHLVGHATQGQSIH